MAEAAGQVRLVRCPKCENLLPELPDLSLYKCGACGAALRAKRNGSLDDGLSEVSDEVKGSGQSAESSSSIAEASASNMESIVGGERNLFGMGSVDEIERTYDKGGVASHGSSMLQPKRTDTSFDYDDKLRRRGKERMRRMQTLVDDELGGPYFRGIVGFNRNRGTHHDVNAENRPEYAKFHGKNARGFCDDFLHHNEGQSSYDRNSNCKQGERTRYPNHGLDELARIESLENGRAELLRKLDELKDQITRSCDLEDKPVESIGIDPVKLSASLPHPPYGRLNAAAAGYVQGRLIGSQGPGKQLLGSNGAPPYANQFGAYNERVLESFPQNGGWGYPHEFARHPHANRGEMIGRPTRRMGGHEYHSSYYGNANPELFMLNRHDNFFHQPACSCVHCREKNWHMPLNVDRPGLHNQRFQQGPSNPCFHQSRNPILHQPQGNTFAGSAVHHLHSQQHRTQHAVVDMDSDSDGLDFHRPRKFGLPHRRGRVRYPIAGGAPFITCDNCFELLKISRRHVSLAKNQPKLKCGACSSIVLLALGNKGFVASVSARTDQVPPKIDENSNGISVDSEKKIDDTRQNLEKSCVSAGSKRIMDPLSSASSLYNGVDSPENVASRKHSPPAELPMAQPDEPPEERANADPENVADTQFADKHQEKERASFDIPNTEGSYVAASGVATEISLNGISNSYVSQNSVGTDKDHSNGKKGGKSFFAGLIKRGFKDFGQPSRGAEVFINGHLIPDHAVKRAERLAGQIQPGDYWYDKKAGFWGVMGHPCLGIIMPNIEEFNYPMPENCAAGDTGVYVNGRELNQRDLDLLAKRGLPATEYKSYLIKISGEVVDEQTGEQLESLGKLAPTVLRAGHGFGMKVHRFLGQQKS
ncbi:uncharacterized protein LOC127243401 [Andrographis paniculata]|uniref:uncharacterized protein LOC127243401 n=1 Tax=Andrographis paniculata TaxID=175694 RepID=UPI0021E711C8|nr:uncharacterized protein LOC127243401 [Andrographis paniculata]